MASLAAAAAGKKSFTCSICHCKHQSARGQQCKQLKNTLPIFTSYVRNFDVSRETSFARNTDSTLSTVFAIRRIMAFMHSNKEAYQTWSEENPTAEVGLESSVIQGIHNDEEEESGTIPMEAENDPVQFLRLRSAPTPPESITTQPVKQVASDKGPAPPCLSYEFLSRAPRITAMVLKKP